MNLTMKTPSNRTFDLHRDDFISALKTDPGTIVVCEKGILWLTQPEDPRDYMLQPGEKMVIKQRGDVLIEALSEAHLSIIHPN